MIRSLRKKIQDKTAGLCTAFVPPVTPPKQESGACTVGGPAAACAEQSGCSAVAVLQQAEQACRRKRSVISTRDDLEGRPRRVWPTWTTTRANVFEFASAVSSQRCRAGGVCVMCCGDAPLADVLVNRADGYEIGAIRCPAHIRNAGAVSAVHLHTSAYVSIRQHMR
jgi:hypothetical protein